MIKNIFIILILVIFASTMNVYGDDKKVEVKSLISFLTMGTGSTTGTYYPLGLAFANVMSSKLKEVDVMAISTRGSQENIRLLQNKELKLAIAQSDMVYKAVKSEGTFEGEDHKNLKVLLSLYPEVVQILVPDDSDIKSIKDLKGKRVIMGGRGSGNAKTAASVLSAFGIYENDITPGFLSYDAAISAMVENKFDAFFLVAGLPTKVVTELKSRIDIRIVEFSNEEITEICKKLEYLSVSSIKENTYKNQSNKINSIALKALLISTSELPEETAQGIIKVIFDNIKYLQQMHPRASDISFETYKDAVPEGCLHIGSEKYFQENKK